MVELYWVRSSESKLASVPELLKKKKKILLLDRFITWNK